MNDGIWCTPDYACPALPLDGSAHWVIRQNNTQKEVDQVGRHSQPRNDIVKVIALCMFGVIVFAGAVTWASHHPVTPPTIHHQTVPEPTPPVHPGSVHPGSAQSRVDAVAPKRVSPQPTTHTRQGHVHVSGKHPASHANAPKHHYSTQHTHRKAHQHRHHHEKHEHHHKHRHGCH